ncbi:hypothetical protein NA56DRAFT_320862 [Hyaloscypha hepaticicola]|uniref:C2H2-type domain-containing protein n=1 Tax=Hyaloscypha hepaticicola TaxID=2082293 RepID=A0A2J6PPX6_9HELO|nr:hypothetical protein NA56DRAFT_320862 [Hyaloscypha hepaticicola]
MSQLEGTTMTATPIEHKGYRRDGDVTSFPTMGKFESTSEGTTLDIGREWCEIFEWPEWEDERALNKDNGGSLLFKHNFELPLPNSESPVIQPNGNDIEHTKETLTHHPRNSFGHGDANIPLDMIFPEQVEINSSLHYTTPRFGLSSNLASTEDIQEEALTAIALDMNPQPSKCGKQRDSGMLPEEINISDTFAGNLSSTDRDHDDQSAAPTALPSLPTLPTTPDGPPFICMHSTCRRSFNRLAELRRHQRGHVGNRSFFCSFIGCKRASHGFVRKDNLSQHLRRVHQVAA